MLNHLDAADAAAFEEHYFICASCATVVQDMAIYVDAMKRAAERITSALWSAGGSN